jgi:hypothetical protein
MQNALVHYGHTLSHRISPILNYFDGFEKDPQQAAGNARMLSDISLVLQLSNINTIGALLEHNKRNRFLAYEDEAGSLDLVKLIKEDWSKLAEKSRSLGLIEEQNRSKIQDVWACLSLRGPLKSAIIDHTLKDSDGRSCRLDNFIYRELFYELLRNAVNYGFPDPTEQTHRNMPVYKVVVRLEADEIDSLPVVILKNMTEKPPPNHLLSEKWKKWPRTHEHDGPGMALANIRRLGLGEMWFSFDPLKKIFRVAVHLNKIRLIVKGS